MIAMIAQAAAATPCPEVFSITWPAAFCYVGVAFAIAIVALFKL